MQTVKIQLKHLKDLVILLLFQDLLGGGAGSSAGTSQAEGGPVQEDGGGRQRRADSPGAFPTWRHQTSLHAMEGDDELHQHPRLQDRRDQGRGRQNIGSDMPLTYHEHVIIRIIIA